MGFTKLDEDILKSSIMAADSDTFKVWIVILAACRETGIAPVSEIFLSAVCHLDMAKVEAAIKYLESPDPHSRTTESEGRRIERVSGGFSVLNYHSYREKFHYSGKPESERKRAYRQRKRDMSGTCPGQTGTFRDLYASASASVFLDFNTGRFQNITEEQIARWKEAFPAVDVETAIKRIAAYFIANPAKRKSNWQRAIVNWLKRDQERGGDIGPGRRPDSGTHVGAHQPRKLTEEEFQSYRAAAEKNIRRTLEKLPGMSSREIENTVADAMRKWDRDNAKRRAS